jgi:hypothetical protein
MRARLKVLREIVLATLREVFDENAYARYLARTGAATSRASYAGFLAERRAADERRVRCC